MFGWPVPARHSRDDRGPPPRDARVVADKPPAAAVVDRYAPRSAAIRRGMGRRARAARALPRRPENPRLERAWISRDAAPHPRGAVCAAGHHREQPRAAPDQSARPGRTRASLGLAAGGRRAVVGGSDGALPCRDRPPAQRRQQTKLPAERARRAAARPDGDRPSGLRAGRAGGGASRLSASPSRRQGSARAGLRRPPGGPHRGSLALASRSSRRRRGKPDPRGQG